VAVELGQRHQAVDGGATVAVGAVAVVVRDAAAEVPGHAAEAQRAELAVDLAPGALGADARQVAVLAHLGRILRLIEKRDRRRARQAVLRLAVDPDQRIGRRPHEGVVEHVDLRVHAHLVGHIQGRLQAQAQVRGAQALGAARERLGAHRVGWRAIERHRERRQSAGGLRGDAAVRDERRRRLLHRRVALAEIEVVKVVAAHPEVAVDLEDLHLLLALLGVAAERLEIAWPSFLLGRGFRRTFFLGLLPHRRLRHAAARLPPRHAAVLSQGQARGRQRAGGHQSQQDL
jgi:hypothetical protein